MAMELPGIHLQQRLMEALEILHDPRQTDFPARVIAACQQLMPETFNGFELWHKTDGTYTGLLNAPFDDAGLEERLLRVATVLPRDNAAFAQVAAGERGLVRLSDFSSQRQLKATEYYDLALRPLGLIHQIAIPLHTRTHIGGVVFNRGGQCDFDADEMRAATLLGRHILLAHATAQALAAAEPALPFVSAQDHLPLSRRGLTLRQAEVLHWIAQGKRDKEIALILGVSYRTVTDHVRAILVKLGVETRTAAAAEAMRGE